MAKTKTEEPIVCRPRVLPPHLRRLAAAKAVEINPANRPNLHLMVLAPEQIALLTGQYWSPAGVALTVGFLDSPAADLRARILRHMNAWAKTANIHFRETVHASEAQVRIARVPGDGYWSNVGTDILQVPADQPTMNLDSFTMRTSEEEFTRVVRHETGHTLGFPHERLPSEIVARIDRAKAYAYFGAPPNLWDKQTVDLNVLTPLEDSHIMGGSGAPDVVSIMTYQLPGEIMLDGRPVLGGRDIDDVDYAFAATIYPKELAGGRDGAGADAGGSEAAVPTRLPRRGQALPLGLEDVIEAADRASLRALEAQLAKVPPAGSAAPEGATMPETGAPRGPYKGPVPFEIGDILFGRDAETFDLLHRLLADRVVLLCSPSGAGKTSLLKAGLVPALRRRGFVVPGPVVRAGAEPPRGTDANRYLLATVQGLHGGDGPTSPEDVASRSLAGHLRKTVAVPDDAEGAVLIFDQFEEVLSLDPTDVGVKDQFFAQVAAALRPTPDGVPWLAIFALREEYLAALDPYRAHFANLLASRYRLELLTPEAAAAAIRGPAEAAGVRFEDAGISRLIEDLRQVRVQSSDGHTESKPGPFVEPVQLQVVCARLWAAWRAERPAAGAIELDDVEKHGNVERALTSYYEQTVEKVAERAGTKERAVREFIDRYLITEHGLRGQVPLGPDATKGLPNKAVWLLVNAYLVRAETRLGTTWLELAHDRLLTPVRANNTTWFPDHLSTLQLQAALWQEKGRPDGLLLRGAALQEGRRWAADHADEMTDAERDYLALCERAARAESLKVLLIVFLALLTLVSVSLALYSVRLNQMVRTNNRALNVTLVEKAALEEERRLNGVANLRQNAVFTRITAQQKSEFAPRPGRPADLVGGPVPTVLKMWQPGSTLRLRFLDNPPPEVQAKIRAVAQEWTLFANLRFDFLEPKAGVPDPQVRISLTPGEGNWSYLGVDSLMVPQDQPTMNFGSFNRDTPDREYRQVVLHNFGHLLGLINEHLNPNARIRWDREAVYRYFEGPPNFWTRTMIDRNYLTPLVGAYRPFDPQSVMAWPIPAALTLDGFEIGVNSELSRVDKQFIGDLYHFADPPRDVKVNGPAVTFVPERLTLYRFKFTATQPGRYAVQVEGPPAAELHLTDIMDAPYGPGKSAGGSGILKPPAKETVAKVEADLKPGEYRVKVRYLDQDPSGPARLTVHATPARAAEKGR
jgi:hypothetical protein